jgi:sugar/nucleoside kinase (ribokinase family)
MKNIVVIGDIMIDIVAVIEEEINRGSDTASNTSMQFGGAAANVATWIGLENVACNLIGSVGDDVFGSLFRSRFEQLGISTSLFTSTSNTGSVIAISHPDKERSMLSELGANIDVAKAFHEAVITNNSIVYLSGYVLFQESNANFVQQVIQRAIQTSSTLLLDPASVAPLRKSMNSQMSSWLHKFDYLLPNEDELQALTNLGFISQKTVIEKRGADGVRIHKNSSIEDFAALNTPIVDTVGAGDAFAAGFLVGLSRGLGDSEAVSLGITLASKACQIRGATPSRLEIK